MSTETLPAETGPTSGAGGVPRTPPKRVDGGVMSRPRGVVVTVIVAVLALVWLFPLLWALVNSFREYDYTQANGYLSLGGWTTSNYEEAWSRGNFGLHLKNSLLVTIPAVLLTLWLSSMVAFVLARFSYRFNLLMLGIFLAANLLPPQALLIPVFRMFREIPLPLLMSDYMKTLPHEIYESAELDGASVWRQYWQLTMPLVRPALAALATLQFTWVYNEFFWATVLIQRGDKLPVTSALNNLRGQFF